MALTPPTLTLWLTGVSNHTRHKTSDPFALGTFPAAHSASLAGPVCAPFAAMALVGVPHAQSLLSL